MKAQVCSSAFSSRLAALTVDYKMHFEEEFNPFLYTHIAGGVNSMESY